MQNTLISSAITLIGGFLANKFLPGSATWAVPLLSALAGVFLKQTPKDGAMSGLLGGGVLGAIGSAMGDGGIGSALSSLLGGGALGSVLGTGVLGGAGGGIGGFLQGMLNKGKA